MPKITFAIIKKKLVRVLRDWWPPFAGCHLDYPSRHQPTLAFELLVDECAIAGRLEGICRTISGDEASAEL